LPLVVQYSGRVCLLGEHCDWAGGASLTVPAPLSVVVAVDAPLAPDQIRVRTALHGDLREQSFGLQGEVDPAGGPLRFAPAAAAALHRRGIALRACHLYVHATLPAGRGFSSSAAYTLGVLDALARSAGQALEHDALAALAYEVEHELLGVPCGRLDPMACAAGAAAYIRWRADGSGRLRRIQPLRPLHLAVGVWPQPRPAAPLLSALRAHTAADLRAPEDREAAAAVAEALATFAHTADAGAHAVRVGDLAALGAAMDRAQAAYAVAAQALPALAAPQLVATCARLRDEHGALGAKFSGAGGDRSIVALGVDEDHASRLRGGMEAAGLTAWALRVDRV